MDFSPFWISLKVAVTATLFSSILGILLAWLVAGLKTGKGILDAIFTLPLVLPPTVLGFLLLVFFGKNSFAGQLLEKIGITVIFNITGAIIAATIVAFPLIYRTVRAALEAFNSDYISVAQTLGMSKINIFLKVVIPNIFPSIMAGVVLAFARSLGEFGATIMIAGNIPGKTQTMSVAVYTAVQAGNRELAFKWVLVICAISLVAMLLMNYWNSFVLNKQKGEK